MVTVIVVVMDAVAMVVTVTAIVMVVIVTVTVIAIVMAATVVVVEKVKVAQDLQTDAVKENIIAVSHKLNSKKRMPFSGILFLFL